MKAIQGYYLIKPEDLHWRPSNLMKIPNADYLERTGSENIGARSGDCHRRARTRCTSTSVPRNFILCSKARAACASETKPEQRLDRRSDHDQCSRRIPVRPL